MGAAIRYAVLAPGKRLRPALVLMAAEACGGGIEDAMPGAVAVEMIHAYSLIHDDLPAMDDDDLRRGRPTVHIAFDEATAILAGDALQPQAFRYLSEQVRDPVRAVEAIRILAAAAGCERLVGGQADDLAAESSEQDAGTDGKPLAGGVLSDADAVVAAHADSLDLADPNSEPHVGPSRRGPVRTLEHLESIHRRKTGALFTASLEMGAVLSGASDQARQCVVNYAGDLGLAFQVVDDLLDHLADEGRLGKRSGKDAQRGKLTYPGLLGIEGAKQKAEQLIQSAKRHVVLFEDAAWRLNWLANYVLERTH
ncbi:MAG: polyprenyl synthetase family protein [Pirellulaceae bacterium]|nr:polyprenyl synthetase family protein [Pirellulaceae bacterium]